MRKSKDFDFEQIEKCLKHKGRKVFLYPEDIDLYKFVYSSLGSLEHSASRPDAYALIDGTLLLLEHFAFDNSHSDKNGTNQNKQQSATYRELSKQLDDMPFIQVSDNLQIRGIVETHEHIIRANDYYIDNLNKTFTNHASKINHYKSEITALYNHPINEIKTGFVIEEISTFGSIYIDNHNQQQIVDLVDTKEFLDLFEAQDNLDFVLFTTPMEKSNGFQRFISRNCIKLARKNQIELSSIHLLSSNSTVREYDLKFPSELTELLKKELGIK